MQAFLSGLQAHGRRTRLALVPGQHPAQPDLADDVKIVAVIAHELAADDMMRVDIIRPHPRDPGIAAVRVFDDVGAVDDPDPRHHGAQLRQGFVQRMAMVDMDQPDVLGQGQLLDEPGPQVMGQIAVQRDEPDILMIRQLASQALDRGHRGDHEHAQPGLKRPLHRIKSQCFGPPDLQPMHADQDCRLPGAVGRFRKRKQGRTLAARKRDLAVHTPRAALARHLGLVPDLLVEHRAETIESLQPPDRHPGRVGQLAFAWQRRARDGDHDRDDGRSLLGSGPAHLSKKFGAEMAGLQGDRPLDHRWPS